MCIELLLRMLFGGWDITWEACVQEDRHDTSLCIATIALIQHDNFLHRVLVFPKQGGTTWISTVVYGRGSNLLPDMRPPSGSDLLKFKQVVEHARGVSSFLAPNLIPFMYRNRRLSHLGRLGGKLVLSSVSSVGIQQLKISAADHEVLEDLIIDYR